MTVVVAFSRPETAQRFAGALEAEGLSVLRVCTAGAQALRALEPCEDAVLVCGARLPDRTADELARDLDGRPPCSSPRAPSGWRYARSRRCTSWRCPPRARSWPAPCAQSCAGRAGPHPEQRTRGD
ncbi:MAG TPA: hypothetical protein IAB73_00380 [Candidatus Onthenecus intestinigallinarum]|uniref:Uncharacterized protein n=1 Tax=Candidatus Onthenecus intestinigallinarum TaxID=2840875 RepID=A0A9D0ZA53_9FIRM|nr:hypothetical protein [Candidatus Onthenecus intestinigallinarum]